MKNYDWTPDRELTPPDVYDRECCECGRPISDYSDYWCSDACFEASLL